MTGKHQAGPVMSPTQETLTFLDDNTLLIISSLGLACVVTVVLWVARTLDWRRTVGLDRENDGDPALLGPRTRVIPGGRQAAKAARKEAKKRAKAEFKRSHQSSSNQQRRTRLHVEVSRSQLRDNCNLFQLAAELSPVTSTQKRILQTLVLQAVVCTVRDSLSEVFSSKSLASTTGTTYCYKQVMYRAMYRNKREVYNLVQSIVRINLYHYIRRTGSVTSPVHE